MSTLPFQGFEVVLTHAIWVKLHYDNTLGTLIHIIYHTPRGVWMLVYHTAAAVHLYAAFLGF
jgi:hypothetical protein